MDHPSPTPDSPTGPLALVMGGGGARAAYQVGFLRALAERSPELEVPILTGVSAGAINAVYLAAHPGNFQEKVEDLAQLWLSLSTEKVFRVDARTLGVNTLRWGLQLVSGGVLGRPRIRSLVDTSPLRTFLRQALAVDEGPIPGIQDNLEAGRLRALALSTSSYSTGRSITWVQGREIEPWARPRRRARVTQVEVDHIMASAALPLFFPAIQIGQEWFGDGGIRLTAPLSPALHLGAHRVLALSTRFHPTPREAEHPLTRGYPPPAQVIGSLLNAVFLDLLEQDAWRVELINDLLRQLPAEERGDRRIVELLTLRPSRDLGQLADEFEFQLPGLFRFLIRGLGTRETESPDVLSFLLFEPSYIGRLIEMGERDAQARMGEIETLLGISPQNDLPSLPGSDPAPGAEPPAPPGVVDQEVLR